MEEINALFNSPLFHLVFATKKKHFVLSCKSRSSVSRKRAFIALKVLYTF